MPKQPATPEPLQQPMDVTTPQPTIAEGGLDGRTITLAMARDWTPAQAFVEFQKDPLGFVIDVANGYFEEQASLHRQGSDFTAALMLARQQDADFAAYEPQILEEAQQLVKEQGEGFNAPWVLVLQQAKQRLANKLKALVPQQLVAKGTPPPAFEVAGPKKPAAEPPSFSKKAIAAMSLEEFRANEPAILEAMKRGRIV